MNLFEHLNILEGTGICYSGFREGQRPGHKYPTYDQVLEDLLLLQNYWSYLRLYDCDEHAETVLKVIQKEKLDFKILLGAHIDAEINNELCPWGGGVYSEANLKANRLSNLQKMDKLAAFANAYPSIVFAVSVGNEACVDWTDHYVHEDQVLEYVKRVKSLTDCPVTFCENYVPWLNKLENLVDVLDFISIHTYPIWEFKQIDEALEYTKENFSLITNRYPEKPVIITEAGWATKSNGSGIAAASANEIHQKIYFESLMQWVEEENIMVFFFEAFDEPWKGSNDPLEPEKHWGLFNLDRSPKDAAESFLMDNKKIYKFLN